MNQRNGGRYQNKLQRSNVQDRNQREADLRSKQRRTSNNEPRPCNDAGGRSYWKVSAEEVKGGPSKRVRSRDTTRALERDECEEESKRHCIRKDKKEPLEPTILLNRRFKGLEQIINQAENQQKREEQDRRGWEQMSVTEKASAMEAQRIADEKDAMEAEQVVHTHDERRRTGTQWRAAHAVTKAAHWVAWEYEQEEQEAAELKERQSEQDYLVARDMSLKESREEEKSRQLAVDMHKAEKAQEQKRLEDIARSEHLARSMQETEEAEERIRKERAAQIFRKDADKRARQQAEQHGGRYNELAKAHLVAMVSLRCLEPSGDKATLVQKLTMDDYKRKNIDDEDSDDQAPEDSVQVTQQAEPGNLIERNQCPICYDETEENNRMYLHMCCLKWTCITCSLKWIDHPRCMLCNVNKTEGRSAEDSRQHRRRLRQHTVVMLD